MTDYAASDQAAWDALPEEERGRRNRQEAIRIREELDGEAQHTCRLYVRRTGWGRDCPACVAALSEEARRAYGVNPANLPQNPATTEGG